LKDNADDTAAPLVSACCPPIFLGHCPPLKRGFHPQAITTSSDYFEIHSQADADQLKRCYTVGGDLIISGRNATGPLIIEGPRIINGSLIMQLYSGPENPKFTFVTMKCLKTVHSTLSVRTQWSGPFEKQPPKPPVRNLGVLNFPALKYVARGLLIQGLESVHTINLPSLKQSGSSLWVENVPELHTIHVPKIAELRMSLHLKNLPSLTRMPSLFNIEGPISELSISETGLTAVSFPRLKALANLIITDNKNLIIVDLPKASMWAGSTYNPGGITVAGNNPDLSLSLLTLGAVNGMVSLSGLRKVEFPKLAIVGDYNSNPLRPREGSLLIGAQDEWKAQCTNCLPTYLTSFSAPRLTMVMGRIQFDSSPNLRRISFPVLDFAGEFMTNNTLAMELENGLSTPRLRRVGHVQVLGTRVSCEFWKNLYCTGGVEGNYSCARTELWSPDQTHFGAIKKKWPSFPPNCTGKETLPPPAPTQDPNMVDRFQSVGGSRFVFEHFLQNYSLCCNHSE
jgi:hypothetical protein